MSNEAKLKKTFISGHKWARRSAIAVAAGLLLEIIADFPCLEKTPWAASVRIFGLAVGVVGVMGDFYFRGKAEEAGADLQRISDQKVAEANARALEAQLALEKFKAPRTLSPEQQQRIGYRMLPFTGRRVGIAAFSMSSESYDLGNAITEALKNAGIETWVNQTGFLNAVGVLGPPTPTLNPENISKGVTVKYTTGNEAGKKFAEALAAVLNDENITTIAADGLSERQMAAWLKRGQDRNDPAYSAVTLIVGDKI